MKDNPSKRTSKSTKDTDNPSRRLPKLDKNVGLGFEFPEHAKYGSIFYSLKDHTIYVYDSGVWVPVSR